MRIGVPREIKDGERRVGLVPDGVGSLVDAGHDVLVERDAGRASGFDDPQYIAQGAQIVDQPEVIWECPLIVKVKEVQRAEYGRLTAGTTILGFAQLNRDPVLLDAVLERRVRVLAYETVRDADDRLPLLAPMSRIAGRLAPIVGAHALQTQSGGNGTLITGVDAVDPAHVVVVGAGNSGAEAARVAGRLGCRVSVLSRGRARLVEVERSLAQEGLRVNVAQIDDQKSLDDVVAIADLVIGAVLEPGSLSPKLITRRTLKRMRRGSAIVDIGIDQGGICETSRMTTLSHPMYVEEGIVHYAVPNMPALVARTATLALSGATLPYVRKLADEGIEAALDDDPGLARGVMVWEGVVVHAGLAADSGKTAVARAWGESARRRLV